MSARETESYLKTELIRPVEGSHNPVISWSGVSCSGKDWLISMTLSESDPQQYRVLGHGLLIEQITNVSRDQIRNTLSRQAFRAAKLASLPTILNGEPTILNAHVLVKHQGRLVVNEGFEKH